uniref:beta-mannosidase n=1 Tax=Tetradesmus obliquus TaxID=3088 RepID=A0A383VKX2_TETOB|eukprot:jgi/Sobl393_1/13717/SZX65479.1
MAWGLLLGSLLATLLIATVKAEAVLNLDGMPWTLTNGNASISLTTNIPAYPLEVLRSNGVIGDPLYRYGEQDSRWVAFQEWTFSVTFSAEDAAKLAAQEQAVLYLGGVDTFGTISINGQTVLQTNNFHRHWTVPIKSFLDASGPNTLTISIAPAYNTTLEEQAKYPYFIPTLYNTGSIGAYNFARKPAFDFGWGPAFAASGIHGTVKIIAFSKPTLAGAYLAQSHDDEFFTLKVTSQFLTPDSGGYGTLRLALPELNITVEQEVEFLAGRQNSADLFEAATSIQVPRADVELWWPAGGNYGSHKLYNVTIEFEPLGSWCGTLAQGTPRPRRPSTGYSFLDQLLGMPGAPGAASGVDFNLDVQDGLRASLNIGDLFDFNIQIGQGANGRPGSAGSSNAGADSSSSSGTAGAVASSAECSYVRKRIGFRTVELVTDPLDKAVQDLFGDKPGFNFSENPKIIDSILFKQEGWQWALSDNGQWKRFEGNNSAVAGAVQESYYFKVNGVPIFLKGANVIPLSILPSNVTAELTQSILSAAVESHQNLLRVWGGGSYHSQEFYDFCDEHGIMVWQDAMFGGSHYPRNPEWLANIEEEITQQAERLSWHPSILAWCGNNELELSYEWANNTFIRSNRNMFVNDYMANIKTLRRAIKKVNPSNIFISSSPTKGTIVDDDEEFLLRWGWIGDTRYGSVHHYDYMSDCENFRSYPTAKFVTEFGWQSYPMPETYAAAMQPEVDWGVGNPMNEFRNRRTDVTPQFLYQYGLHFKLPKDWNPEDPQERMKRFRSYLWIGHMQHARCYETSLNFWRRLRSHATSLTMGVMYWQLNDIWQGASWSSLDYAGRWKPVHYAVKRAYAPIVIQAILDQSTVDIFIVSDLVNATSANVQLTLVSLNDTAASCSAATVNSQRVVKFSVEVPGLFASKVKSIAVADLLAMRPGCTATTCFLTATATAEDAAPTEAQLWLVPFKAIEFSDPELHIESAEQVSPGTVEIKVTAERPAALVLVSELAPLSGHYNDNAFSINPCEPRVLSFTSHKGEIAPADLKEGAFYVESLFNHSSWSDLPVSGAAAGSSPNTNTGATAGTTPAAAAAAGSNPLPPVVHGSIAQMVAAVEREEESPEEAKGAAAANAAAAPHPVEHRVFVAPGQTLEQVKQQQPAATTAGTPAPVAAATAAAVETPAATAAAGTPAEAAAVEKPAGVAADAEKPQAPAEKQT